MNHPQTGSLREAVFAYAYEQYGHRPDTPFSGMPGSAVLRHPENKKWYAVFLTVPREKLGLPGDGKAEILNLKADPVMMGSLLLEPGILPAYHMQKASWVSILLDGTVDLQQICFLLDVSFSLTAARARKSREKPSIGPRDWLVPANPRYYDVEAPVKFLARRARVHGAAFNHAREAEPLRALRNAPEALLLQIAGEDAPLAAHAYGGGEALPARRGAGVEDVHAPLRRGGLHGHARRGVLHVEMPLAVARYGAYEPGGREVI